MKIFIMHWSRLEDRKKDMNERLKILNIDGEYIEKYNIEEFIPEADFYNKFCTAMIENKTASIFMKQMHTLGRISQEHDYALILEDDVIFCDDFNEKLESYMKQLPEDWDMFFIGNGCDLHIPDSLQKNGANVYLKQNKDKEWPRAISHLQGGKGSTRCLDSYLIKKDAAKKIYETFCKTANGISDPCDWWMNKKIASHNLKVYWAEPTICTQGSQIKKYPSVLNKWSFNT